jgi:hypothetical protein
MISDGQTRVPKTERERVAYHEVGHAAMLWHFHMPVPDIFVSPDGGYGLAMTTRSVQHAGPPQARVPVPVDRAELVIAMAGRAAEAIRYPDLQPDELVRISTSDEERTRHGIREFYGSHLSDAEVSTRVVQLESEAAQILRGLWKSVEALVAMLTHADGFIDGEEARRTMEAALVA